MKLTPSTIRLSPAIERAMAEFESLTKTGSTLEELQAVRDNEKLVACRELDAMAELFKKQDEERKRLWGNKYPREVGDKPPQPLPPVHPVKKAKKKGTK